MNFKDPHVRASSRIRYLIPYILVMGAIVAKQSWATGDRLNFALGILAIPCAYAIWRYGSYPACSK